MSKIYSISGEGLSLLKLKVLDKGFKNLDTYQHKVVCGGNVDSYKKIIEKIGPLEQKVTFKEIPESSHAQQTARALEFFDGEFAQKAADMVLIADDSNFALAAALTAIKKHIPVVALQAGLRNNDRRLFQEINRKAIDSIAEMYFTTETAATKNLIKEGNDVKNIYEVGSLLNEFLNSSLASALFPKKEIPSICYCDFRHPSNDEDPIFFKELIPVLNDISSLIKIVFPLGRKTIESLKERGLLEKFDESIEILPNVELDRHLQLIQRSKLVITDYGNTQEICSILDQACITFGTFTDRPMTVEKGTNHLVGTHLHEMRNLSVAILEGYEKKSQFEKQRPSENMIKIISKIL